LGRFYFARVTPAGQTWRVLVLAIAAIGVAGCEPPAPKNCGPSDSQCAARAVREHVVLKIANWTEPFSRPLDQRVFAAPPEIVDFLRLQNIAAGIRDRPGAIEVTPQFLQDFNEAIAEIPQPVKRRVAGKLTGIFLVRELGSSGFTDQILDARSNPVAGFIALDLTAIDKTANAWATWKENTPFKDQAGYRLAAEIEDRQHDTRKYAIQYILLHEMAHVMAIGETIHPRWDVEAARLRSPENYAFFSASWIASRERNRFESIFDGDFLQRSKVVYYRRAELRGDQMVEAYDHLEHTNFATLYGATNFADDFAEAMANYVHVVMLNKPYRITIYDDDKVAKVYDPCWSRARCREKRKLLEQFLAGP
jgi:hypothetical protein